MNFSFMKLMITSTYMMILILSWTTSSWFSIWVLLEMNTLLYIMLYNNINMNLINSLMKYYIIQSISSNMFILSFMMMNYNFSLMNLNKLLMFLSMWMKIGFFPFSAWYFQMSENMEWKLWFYLNSFQKILPLNIISMNMFNTQYYYMLMLINFIYSTMEIFLQMSFRWMMNCSSIIHYCWMMMSIKFKDMIWQMYLIFYLYAFYVIYTYLKKYNLNSFMNLLMTNNYNIIMIMMMLLFNFMGMPPFLNFFLKLLIIKMINLFMITAIMLILNLISIMIYMYYMMSLMTIKFNNFMNFYSNNLLNLLLFNIIFIFYLPVWYM